MVENGAAAPKSCLSPLEICSPTTAGGLLPAGMATSATKIAFHQLPLWFCLTKETNSKTSVVYVSYFNNFGWINNQQVPFWPRVIETKSRQNLVFDPGGSTGRLSPCPFWGTWRALLCTEALVLEWLVPICSVFLAGRMTREVSYKIEGGPRNIIFRSGVQATRTYCGLPLFFFSEAGLKRACHRGRLEAIGCQGQTIVRERHGAELDDSSAECLVASAIWNREDPRFLDIVYPSFSI